MPLRLFLGFNVLVWLPYGVFCFFQPGYLGEAAGLAIQGSTAATEVRAMYGGLQAAIGCFALAALVRPHLSSAALLTLAFLCTGLALGRLGGLAVDGDVSGYTGGAVGFEIANAALATWFHSRSATAAAA